jgi:hypothetical protein
MVAEHQEEAKEMGEERRYITTRTENMTRI